MKQKLIKGLTPSEYQKRWQKNNRGKCIEYQKTYYNKNKDKIRKSQKKHNQIPKIKEWHKEYNKKWRKKHPEKNRETVRKYRQSPKGKKNLKEWQQKNKDKIRAYYIEYRKRPGIRKRQNKIGLDYYHKHKEELNDRYVNVNGLHIYVGKHRKEVIKQLPQIYDHILNKIFRRKR